MIFSSAVCLARLLWSCVLTTCDEISKLPPSRTDLYSYGLPTTPHAVEDAGSATTSTASDKYSNRILLLHYRLCVLTRWTIVLAGYFPILVQKMSRKDRLTKENKLFYIIIEFDVIVGNLVDMWVLNWTSDCHVRAYLRSRSFFVPFVKFIPFREAEEQRNLLPNFLSSDIYQALKRFPAFRTAGCF